VKDKKLLGLIVKNLKLNKQVKILEAGAGSGIVSKALKPYIKSITAMDSSLDMMGLIQDDTIQKKEGDIRDMPFKDNSFDRVIFRHVLHHCTGYCSVAMNEALRVLKKGGMILVCESVPISDDCVSDFAQFVTLKENRLIFTEEDIYRLLHQFSDIQGESVILEQQSINNWLDNCVEEEEMKSRIRMTHHAASDTYKKAARMKVEDNDIFVDMKFVITTGVKE
jgi:ubiquinone/menaquinone biosynthesis C-methylase UbiE